MSPHAEEPAPVEDGHVSAVTEVANVIWGGGICCNNKGCARFSSTYTKIGMIQRRLALPLCKDDALKFVKRSIFLTKETIRKVKDSLRNGRK